MQVALYLCMFNSVIRCICVLCVAARRTAQNCCVVILRRLLGGGCCGCLLGHQKHQKHHENTSKQRSLCETQRGVLDFPGVASTPPHTPPLTLPRFRIRSRARMDPPRDSHGHTSVRKNAHNLIIAFPESNWHKSVRQMS